MITRLIGAGAALTLAVMPALAQSTAFTYQGRLKNGAAAASGPHDFRFTLFDAASGGLAIAPPQCADNVAVTEGLFTTTLDLGQQFVTASPLFLQIEVRADTGLPCANPAGLVALGLRQPFTAVPIATHAKTAFSLAAADGSPAHAVSVDNTGNVGVGTTVPITPVHIASDTNCVLSLQDTGPVSTQSGFVSFRNSAGSETAWVGYGTPGSTEFSIFNGRSGGEVVLMPASGRVRLGSSGEYLAPGGQENLRLLRGRIGETGVVQGGLGFTSVRLGTGVYRVTFNTPFASSPAVTATCFVSGPLGVENAYASISDLTSAVATIRIQNRQGSVLDAEWLFIAVGPR